MTACKDKLYCCPSMEYFMTSYKNLSDSLHIKPRVILFPKKLQLRRTYEKTIEITNKALHPRFLNYTTNCTDVTLRVFPRHLWNAFLGCEEAVVLEVKLQPTVAKSLNNCRYVYVDASHPKVRFEIPILVCKNEITAELPEQITFLPICPKNSTFYEMVIYNRSRKKLSQTIKAKSSKLKVLRTTKEKIPPNKYTKVLLELKIRKKKAVEGILKAKLGQEIYKLIPYEHITIPLSVHLGIDVLKFSTLKFSQEERKTISICNESNVILKAKVSLATAESLPNIFDVEKEKNLDALPYKHFSCAISSDCLPSSTVTKCTVTYHPTQHKNLYANDYEAPPFSIQSGLKITLSVDNELNEFEEKAIPPPLNAFVKLVGFIKGLEIDIIPKSIDMTTVYFGEEHCVQIKVINIDGLNDLRVKPLKYDQSEVANVMVTPIEGVRLFPCQSAKFTATFFVTTIGRFNIKIDFKVIYGDIFSTHIRGSAQKAHCRVFPDMLCLGEIPIAIPQKRTITLVNPLSVSITVQCSLEEEDGTEVPLVLNVHDVNENLPITVLDPVKHVQRCRAEENEETTNEQTVIEIVKEEQEVLSLFSEHSVRDDDDETSHSTNFGDVMLNSIPLMARRFLPMIKKGKYMQKNDCELLIIDKALSSLLHHDYFRGMDAHKNYMHMDWNALSNDPQEVFLSSDLIYLTPNSNKMFSFIIIPNRVGFQQRFIKIRVCPKSLPECDDYDSENMRRIIDTQYMVTNLTVEFTCAVPNIMWVKKVKMEGKVYPGKWYKFEMVFENPGAIAGFFFYDMVPKSSQGEMKFLNDKWKYFIEPHSQIAVPCAVEFKAIGAIVLPGLLKFLGMPVGYSFFIESFVLPSAIRYEPQSITKRIQVLKNYRIYVYIHNITPTPTWFHMEVKNEFIDVYPTGAQLHPKGQSMYATLSMFFYDPGIYHTNLDIRMEYDNKMKIPINVTIIKMPIIFEPEVRTGDADFQNILCVSEEEFENGEICLQKRIKVINRGKRAYRITIKTKKLSEKAICAVKPRIRGYVTVEPLLIVIQPESELYFDIAMSACEECSIYHEYWIQIYDLTDTKRVESSTFIIKATFIYPKVVWSKNEVHFNYYRTHKYKDHPQWELIYLTNMAHNTLNSVKLKVNCPFYIKLLFEDQFKKELTFSMENFEKKEIFIVLDKKAVQERNLTDVETRILCTANHRVQKPLRLKLNVFVPQLMLLNDNVILFAQEQEAVTYVMLINNKSVKAVYKWRKLHEEWHYISEDENVEQAVRILLSDILDTICFDEIPKPQSKANMTQYYQTYRCRLKGICNIDDNDIINVKEILYDIINELDIERKRYKLDYKSPEISDGNINTDEKIENEKRKINIVTEKGGDENEKRQCGGYIQPLAGESQELKWIETVSDIMMSYTDLELYQKIRDNYNDSDYDDDTKSETDTDHTDPESINKVFDLFINSKEELDKLKKLQRKQQRKDGQNEEVIPSGSSDDENNFQETLYFNQQFKLDESSTDITYRGTSIESCVYYTVDHILDHLKLEDSYTLSLPSTETCETLRSIYFLKKTGAVDEDQMEMCVLHLPPVKTGYEVKASFLLDVVGGQSLHFNITLVNLEKTLKISKDNIYVGMKPWYEKFKSQFNIENVTNYTLKLKLSEISPEHFCQLPKIAAGYVRFLNDHELELPPNEMITLKIEGILGFNEEFLRFLNIKINDGEEKTLHVKGNGVMPMIGPLKYNLQLIEQDLQSTIEDYELLQKVYYFAIFSNITEELDDDEEKVPLREEEGEEDQKQKSSDTVNVTVSMLSTETSDSSKLRENETRFFSLMQTYVLVNNNEELPNAKVLEQLLQTEKFLNRVRSNREIYHQVHTIHHNYEQSKKMFSKNSVINLKSFIVQPLPFELPGVILNLGKVFLNEFRKFKINLEFHGPGKLIASARTAVKLPCFAVDFEIPENTGNKDFTYYQAEDNQLCLPKSYRNMHERITDAQTNSKVKYPHDYDKDVCKQIHQRISNIYERKCIYNYYNSLNKSIYANQKHHVIHCKILTNYKYNLSNTKLNLVILFKPEMQYYKHRQEIEDYLYVDLHLGTTLPILLRGTVIDRKRKDISESDESVTPE